jgi:hypothetical protein
MQGSTNTVQNGAIYDFVNSSVSTNTAYFIGTFNSLSDLENYSGEVSNNDYAFVVSVDSNSNTVYNRYKYNSENETWNFEYSLNNSSFTAAEWETIQSGLTANDRTNYNNHLTNTNNPHSVTKAQVGLGNVDNTSDANKPVSTAMQTALNGKQNTLTFDGTYNASTNKAATVSTVTNAINSLDVSSVGGSGKYISAISQTDGKISATEGTIDSALSESSTNPVENKAVAHEINTIRMALGGVMFGFRIDKQNNDPDTRVEYLYDALGITPAFMNFSGGAFNYGGWGDAWFVKDNRPVALTFAGEVDYELSHTDFTKKIDGTTASDVDDATYGGNFMAEMPCVWVRRWEDERYNYMAFSDKKMNDAFFAYAHTNASNAVQSAIYLPMFKGWKDSNNKLRSLMGTYPTGNTTGTNEVTYASNNGTGWQIWDKAKIDLLMDLIMLITKSTNCRAKIGNGDCQTYNKSDTTNYGKMMSGYETDGTTRSTNAQFYGSEGTDVTNYGKHHMIAFYIEDLWANRFDRCLGFNLINNVYKVKMVAPYTLDSDSSYEILTVLPPSGDGWLKNVSSANDYGDVPIEVGASNTTGFANYFYKNASGSRLSLFGGDCSVGLRVGRSWFLYRGSGGSDWFIGGSPCFVKP